MTKKEALSCVLLNIYKRTQLSPRPVIQQRVVMVLLLLLTLPANPATICYNLPIIAHPSCQSSDDLLQLTYYCSLYFLIERRLTYNCSLYLPIQRRFVTVLLSHVLLTLLANRATICYSSPISALTPLANRATICYNFPTSAHSICQSSDDVL